MEIQIQLAGVQLGPYSEKQVREYLDEGLLSLNDPARFEGNETWSVVKDVLGNAPAPAAVAAVPSAKPAPATVSPQPPIVESALPTPSTEIRKSAAVTTSSLPRLKPMSKDTVRVPIPQLSKALAQQTTLVKKAIPVERPPAAPATPAAAKSSEKARTSLLTAVKILAKKSDPDDGAPTERGPEAPKPSSGSIPIPLPKSADAMRTMPMSVVRAIAKKADLDEKPASSDTSFTANLPLPTVSKSFDPKRTSLLSPPNALKKATPEVKPEMEVKVLAAPKSPEISIPSSKSLQTLRTAPMSVIRALPKKKEPEARAIVIATPVLPEPIEIDEPTETPTSPGEAVRFIPQTVPLPPGSVNKATPVSASSSQSLKRTTGSLPMLVKVLAKKPGHTASLPPVQEVEEKPAPVPELPVEVPAEKTDEPPQPSFFQSLLGKVGLFRPKTTIEPEIQSEPLPDLVEKVETKPEVVEKQPDVVEKKPEPVLKKLLPVEKISEPVLKKLEPEKKPEAVVEIAPVQPAPLPIETADPLPASEAAPSIMEPQPASRRGIVVLLGIVVVVSLGCFVLFYIQSSYHAATSLLQALKTGDQSQLKKLINFPAVRQSLADEVTAQTAKVENQDATSRAAVLAMIKNSINYYVTPEMISALATKSNQLPAPGPDPTVTPAMASGILLKLNDLSVKSEKMLSINSFVIDLDAAKFDLAYDGSRWKLERVELNPDFKLPEAPGASASSVDLGGSYSVPVIETYLEDGKTKFEKQDWDGAIADFNQVLAIDPKQTIAYSNRAMAKKEKNDFDGAIADFTQAISLDPKLAEAYFNRGVVKSAQNDLDGASADFSQAIVLDPKMAGAFYKRGTLRTLKGDYEGAMADFTQNIALDPNSAGAYSNRGYVRKAQNDLDGAIDDFTRALAINPKIVAAYYNRGLAKEAKADYDGAILDYNHALDIDPKMTRAYYSRGNAKITKNDLDGAIADYNQALNLDPTMAPVLTDRALARQAKGDLKGALDDFNRALAIDPKIVDAYYSRGLIKEQLGDLDGAIADSSRALDIDPKRAQAYYNRGFAKLVKGNLDGARADLLKFCDLAPRDLYADHAQLYLWLITMAQSPTGTANQDLSDALQNNWSLGHDDFVTKIAEFLLDRVTEADLINAAASTDPAKDAGQHCELWYFAGMKRLLAGDKATAVDYFRKCMATGEKDYCEYILSQAELQVLAPNP